jgi:hypothetical protein
MTAAFKPDLDRLRLMVADDNVSLSRLDVLATAQRIYDRPGHPTACVHRMPQGATAFYAGMCQRCGSKLKAHTPPPPSAREVPNNRRDFDYGSWTWTDEPSTTLSRKFMVAMDWDTLNRIFPDQLEEFFKMYGGDVIMVKPAQAELIATAPEGGVHLRLKEYK